MQESERGSIWIILYKNAQPFTLNEPTDERRLAAERPTTEIKQVGMSLLVGAKINLEGKSFHISNFVLFAE